MTLPNKRTYEFRIVGWQVFTPEEQERIYMQLLTSKSMEVSGAMRELILEEWPVRMTSAPTDVLIAMTTNPALRASRY